ncbi:MAG TPA: recombinase family protein [Ktedonobacteraceae bacterium]|nr:recombinase family protein [Ktedonobacteraceae bacterium]
MTIRKFKTNEEIQQERQEALGLKPTRMPVDLLLLIYARQSTKGQFIKNRESAKQQTIEQIDRAIELGWPEEKRLLFIENQAKDGTIRSASGTLRIDEREGLSTVMAYINSGEAGAVMGRDVARFFRDEDLVGPVVFAKACKDHHVLVITEEHIYDFNHPKRGRDDYKKFLQEAQAAADYLEKHQKGVMLKNKDRKAQRGEFAGHAVPTGYMLDESRTFYVPNPDHAEAIKMLFKRFRALGGNVASLRREIVGKPIFRDLPPEILERTGRISLTKMPGGWTISTRCGINYILTNPAYIGHVYYNGRIVKKYAHKAIVSEEDFFYAYRRLADIDFDGNPIERPEGVTKRYRQAKSEEPIQALFAGLRHNGTPVIATNIGEKASVYAVRFEDGLRYVIENRSKIAPYPASSAISVGRIDSLLADRLHYRVGEALRNSGEYPVDEDEAGGLEQKRSVIHNQLLARLEEAEKVEDEQSDPHEYLRNAIAGTKAKIAEKERVSEAATDVMDTEDLRKHFESLKRLRRSLAEMEKKLNEELSEKEERETAKGKLPEVYEKWPIMKLEAKQRFIRVVTSRVTLEEVISGWYRLTIEWSPILGGNLVDEAYIWSYRGSESTWTDEEKRILREHYATASRAWLMEQLPERSWEGIRTGAHKYGGGSRKSKSGSTPWMPGDTVIPKHMSWKDWQFIQANDIPAEEVVANRAYWREYVDLTLTENNSTQNRDGLRW